jgi:hypothetical protein
MFGSGAVKWTGFRHTAVVIPLDRPDLMADAGYDGLNYRDPVVRVGTSRDRGVWWATWWMPFHAASG